MLMLAYVAACMGTNANAMQMPRANMIARMVHRPVVRPTNTSGVVTAAMPSMPNMIRRRGPTRWYRRPTSWLEAMTPIAWGKVVSPDCRAVNPRRVCKYSGIRKMTPMKLP